MSPPSPRKPNATIIWGGIFGVGVAFAWWNHHAGWVGFGGTVAVCVVLGLAAFAWILRGQLEEQHELVRHFSAAMDQSPSGIMIVDVSGRIEQVNRSLCVQTGYDAAELVGHGWRDFHVRPTENPRRARMVATVRAGKPWEGEWSHQRKDGTLYPVHGAITPVTNSRGMVTFFVARFDDVSENLGREAELREARDAALAGDRAKGQFLATMSHEVRTPLNGIVGFTSLLLETALSAEQREYVQTIRLSTEALIQLTGDILDFARIESGKLKLSPIASDPRECVEDALDLLAGKAAEKNIELLHRIADDVPAAVMMDGGRVRQVLVNLIGNAVKFTDRGEVDVRVARVAIDPLEAIAMPDICTLRFTVRDTGIGIAPEHHAKLFRPFSQVDESTTRRYGGTGLGLAISRNLVELMEGSIGLESTPGRGSTFSFTVRTAAVAPPPAPLDLGRLRIRIAMPESSVRSELCELLRNWNADTIEAGPATVLAPGEWDVALVEVGPDAATTLIHQKPAAAFPPESTFGLVPISLPNEVRTALRAHFRLLVNKPVRHDALFALLTGSRFGVPPNTPLTQFGYRVLLVEDNPVNQHVAERMLRNLGCTTTLATQGPQALAYLQHHADGFDVMLIDWHLPEMDGITVLHEIRSGLTGPRAQACWVIALTADLREQQRTKAIEAGLNDYLTKPLNILQLEAALKRFRDHAVSKPR